jgi:hypothetical protein
LLGYIHCTLVRSPHCFPHPLPASLKAIARIFIVLFHISIWNPLTIFPHLNLFHSPSFLPQVPSYTIPILQFYLSLLISKLMFKGVSQYILTVSILYFGLFNPFHYSPLPLPSHPPFFNSFQYILLYFCLHRCYVLQYCWCSIIIFSVSSIPKSHSVVLLLQTCYTYKFVYDHVWFLCVYVYLLNLSSMYERKHVPGIPLK